MPKFIIKADRDRDAYIEWSTVVEAPVAFGTREQFLSDGGKEYTPERFDRADTQGTSAMYFDWLPPTQQECGWDDDEGIIYMQLGFLPRARFGDLYDLLQSDADAEIPSSWLVPFDDEGADA